MRKGIDDGSIENLFLVLKIPTTTPFPGVSAQPPLIGLNTTGTIFGQSFLSNDGITFTRRTDLNFMFSLVLSEPPVIFSHSSAEGRPSVTEPRYP